MANLQDALMPGGRSVPVERIEIELLDSGNFRWKLWSEGELIYCRVDDRTSLPDMIDATRVISCKMLGINDKNSQGRG